MRAEDTLQYMADFYSDIFPTRKHALNFLFCTIGTEYEWKNGELIGDSKYEKRYKLRKPIEKAEFEREDNWLIMHETYKELNNIFDDKIPNKYGFEWYVDDKNSLYEGCNLLAIPEDITPDWKALVEECKLLLVADGILGGDEL